MHARAGSVTGSGRKVPLLLLVLLVLLLPTFSACGPEASRPAPAPTSPTTRVGAVEAIAEAAKGEERETLERHYLPLDAALGILRSLRPGMTDTQRQGLEQEYGIRRSEQVERLITHFRDRSVRACRFEDQGTTLFTEYELAEIARQAIGSDHGDVTIGDGTRAFLRVRVFRYEDRWSFVDVTALR